MPEPRKGMPSPQLGRQEFTRRFRAQFQDPAFEALEDELQRVADVAWDAYSESRKAARTRKANGSTSPASPARRSAPRC